MPMSRTPEDRIRDLLKSRQPQFGQPQVDVPEATPMSPVPDMSSLHFDGGVSGPSPDMPTQQMLDMAGNDVPTYTDPFSGEVHYRKPRIAGSYLDMQSGQRMPRLTR